MRATNTRRRASPPRSTTPAVNTGEAAGDTYTGIEGLVGSYYGDYLYGDAAANYIFGIGGNDWIDGLGGRDYLLGGDGNDNMISRAGAEAFDGGAGFDYARYEYATGGVNAALFKPAVNTGQAAGDTYTGIEGLVGSYYGDRLYGNGAANYLFGVGGNDWLDGFGGGDYLYGGDGNDSLVSRAGADALDGGAGLDVARYGYATAGLVAALSNAAANTGFAAGDTYSGIEGLIGSAFADYLYGDGRKHLFPAAAAMIGSPAMPATTGWPARLATTRSSAGQARQDAATGGAGGDVFTYYSLADSGLTSATMDIIRDFVHLGDRIDVSAIDAMASTAGNNTFSFVGTAAFSGEGQIRAAQSGGHTVLQFNTSDTGGSDMSLLLLNFNYAAHPLAAADFVL